MWKVPSQLQYQATGSMFYLEMEGITVYKIQIQCPSYQQVFNGQLSQLEQFDEIRVDHPDVLK